MIVEASWMLWLKEFLGPEELHKEKHTEHVCVWGRKVWVAGVEVWVKLGIGGG